MSDAMVEMPKHKSHKEVWALKIRDIVWETDGSAKIIPEGDKYAPLKVDREYCTKHNPTVGGYYVQYKDGYKSFCPAEAFEDGYRLASMDSVKSILSTPYDKMRLYDEYSMAVLQGMVGKTPLVDNGSTEEEVNAYRIEICKSAYAYAYMMLETRQKFIDELDKIGMG